MKLHLILSATTLMASASAFAPRPQPSSSTALQMGWLDFKPFHGHGSGEHDVDEQWETQQAILRERRTHGIDKAHLKQKYKDADSQKFEVHSMKQQHFSFDDTYVEEDTKKKPAAGKKMKFFWEK